MRTPSPTHCSRIVSLLQTRDGRATTIELLADRVATVFNIAWGDDLDDNYEHISTNISPEVDGASFDFFFTDEVARVVDPATHAVLWETDGIPTLR